LLLIRFLTDQLKKIILVAENTLNLICKNNVYFVIIKLRLNITWFAANIAKKIIEATELIKKTISINTYVILA